jgi:hypothetical protein
MRTTFFPVLKILSQAFVKTHSTQHYSYQVPKLSTLPFFVIMKPIALISPITLLLSALFALTAATPLSNRAHDPVLSRAANSLHMSCSKCINFKGNIRYLYATGKCETLENGEQYYACGKPYRCGICMIFQGEQCKYILTRSAMTRRLTSIGMGDLVPYSDKGWEWAKLKGAQSYYCIDG